jgi:hypothetical protein
VVTSDPVELWSGVFVEIELSVVVEVEVVYLFVPIFLLLLTRPLRKLVRWMKYWILNLIFECFLHDCSGFFIGKEEFIKLLLVKVAVFSLRK